MIVPMVGATLFAYRRTAMRFSINTFTVLFLSLMSALATAGPVNVNTADADTLSSELQGIGAAKAAAIVAYRDANGPFQNADDLLNVTGFGEHTLELNRDNIRLEAPQQGAPQ